jgi:AraC-like DNA-binding protein
MLYLIGIILTTFLLFLLLMKRNKVYSDKVLMVWMAVMAIHQLLFYSIYSGFAFQHPHLLGPGLSIPVLHGPLLFFYVSSMTPEKELKYRKLWPHLIPFLVLTVLAIPFYILSAEEKLAVFRNKGKGFEWYIIIQQILIMATGIGYVLWSLILIRRHRSNIKQWFSNTEKKNLRWLEYLSIGLGLIWLLVIFFDDDVIFAGVVALVLFIGFFGINQLPIFYNWQEIDPPKIIPGNPDTSTITETGQSEMEVTSTRYAKSGLKEEEAKELHNRLTQLMEKEALYRKNDLTLQDLANRLDTHPNYLSQVINEKEHKNFYTYINNLRVKAFIENASRGETKTYTLLALAFNSGFNSKSTFNKYFKESTGKSPSEYFSA